MRTHCLPVRLGPVLLLVIALACWGAPATLAATSEMAGSWLIVWAPTRDAEGRVRERRPPQVVLLPAGEEMPGGLIRHWLGVTAVGKGERIEARWIAYFSRDQRSMGPTPPAPVIEALNHRGLEGWFEGGIGEDPGLVEGVMNSYWIEWNRQTHEIIDVTDLLTEVRLIRTDIALRFVARHRDEWRPVRRVAAAAPFAAEVIFERPVGAERIELELAWRGRDATPLAVTARPVAGDSLYRTGQINAVRPRDIEAAFGLEIDGVGARVWAPRGERLVAALPPLDPGGVMIQGSILEAIMEVTSAVVLFGLLAFMVERLTNGIALVCGYNHWWAERFEYQDVTDSSKRTLNERNRRVALFLVSVVLAVPGAMLLGIDPVSQLLVTDLPGYSGEIATGLLVASGADPIRELIKSRGERSSEPSPLHVTGTLVLQQPGTLSADLDAKDKAT